MIKYVYEIDYPLGEKRKYLEWVRTIAGTLQAPGELKELASYDNVFSATPQRVVEFTFESLEEAGRYFGRKEISRIFQSERPVHGCDIGVKVLALRSDYSKDTAGRRPLPGTTGPRSCPPGARPGAEGRTAEEPWGERTNRAAKPATTSH